MKIRALVPQVGEKRTRHLHIQIGKHSISIQNTRRAHKRHTQILSDTIQFQKVAMLPIPSKVNLDIDCIYGRLLQVLPGTVQYLQIETLAIGFENVNTYYPTFSSQKSSRRSIEMR